MVLVATRKTRVGKGVYKQRSSISCRERDSNQDDEAGSLHICFHMDFTHTYIPTRRFRFSIGLNMYVPSKNQLLSLSTYGYVYLLNLMNHDIYGIFRFSVNFIHVPAKILLLSNREVGMHVCTYQCTCVCKQFTYLYLYCNKQNTALKCVCNMLKPLCNKI